MFDSRVGSSQIVADPGNPTNQLQTSRVIQHGQTLELQYHGVEITTPGTYSFREIFRPGMAGQIVVL